MSIVKSKILVKLADSYPQFLRKDLKKVLDLVFNQIIKSLSKSNTVEIRNFGTFKIKIQKERQGRNPKDGSKIQIPKRKTIQWKMSRELKKVFNQDINKNES